MPNKRAPLYFFDLAGDYPRLGGVADVTATLRDLLGSLPGLELYTVRQLLGRRLVGFSDDLFERERQAARWLARQYSSGVFFFPNFYNPLRRSFAEGPRVVNLIHDLQFLYQPQFFSESRQRWLRDQFALTGQQADLLIFISEATRADYLAHFPAPRRAVVIRHPIPPGLPARLEGQRPYLLTCAHYDFHPHKNFQGTLALFAALAQHPAAPKNVELHLTGHGQDSFEREVLGRLPIELRPRVVHHGFVSSRRLEHLHRGARAYLSLSLFEGFNLPVAQAASHDVPLLLSDLPVHRELYPHALHLNALAPDLEAICAFIRHPRHLPWPCAAQCHPDRVAARYAEALAPLW